MRLSAVELASEPPVRFVCHPRLTVVAADERARAALVSALEQLLAGRLSDISATLTGAGAGTTAAVTMASAAGGLVVPGVPTVVRAVDFDDVVADALSPVQLAERRSVQAAESLREAEAGREAAAARLDVLQRRRVALLEATNAGAGDCARAAQRVACRSSLRAYAVELEAAAHDGALAESVRVELLSRGTVLAADAARLGVLAPATTRDLLDAIGALNDVAVRTGNATPVCSLPPAVLARLDSDEPIAEIQSPDADLDVLEAELGTAADHAAQLERTAATARSRTLGTFAELESLRREAGAVHDAGFVASLRVRLARNAATSWVGATPIVVDDALAACPPGDRGAARALLLESAQHHQLLYVTGDPDAHEWARELPDTAGAFVVPNGANRLRP